VTPYFRISMMVLLWFICMFLWIPAKAQTQSASFGVSLTVLPRFKVLSEQPLGDGTKELIVDTNMREITLDGVTYALARPGVQTLRVPAGVAVGPQIGPFLLKN